MFSQDKQFRRPDGTLYDPSSLNVRQYEEQYGPGGVPEGWSMAATTPVQSPGLITALAAFTTALSLGMIAVGAWAIGAGKELTTILLGFGVGAGGLVMSVQAFRTAAKRRRWLQAQRSNAGQEH
ncbi:hypothetical protein ACTHQ6_19115 [Arthrobacter sp. SAFR-179]|uniref:hypothetical protein n=1 Tax=Arthrobacter sp. SAFR-179 TaxID=3387279 RepID=UPI003F7BDF40